MVVVLLQNGFQVRFVKAAGAGTGAEIVEPPDCAVGQDAPADATVGHFICRVEIPENLAVRGAAAGGFAAIAVVERQAEALALLNHKRVLIAIFGTLACCGPVLRLPVGKEQVIGNVLLAV